MKQLDQIYRPDNASLDLSVAGPYFNMTEEAYEAASLAGWHHDLESLVCPEDTPLHIYRDLELTKNLLLYSHFVFDFTTAAVHYAQIALEASLRRALGKNENCRDNIKQMIEEAIQSGKLSKTDNILVAFPQLIGKSRNGFAHGKEDREILNHALAVPYVRMIFDIIHKLFPTEQSIGTEGIDQ